MDRPNYFVLLGITEPEKFSTWALLEPVLKKKKTEWSMPHPKRADEFKSYLSRVKEMERVFLNPVELKQELDRAKVLLATQKADGARELDGVIQVTSAKGYLINEDIVRLVSRGTGKWTEKEVRDAVSRKGIEIRAAETLQATEPKLDSSRWRQIEDGLKILDLPDLYKLLELPASTSTAELKKRADERLRDIRQHAEKTAQVNARQSLYGVCCSLFKAEAERAKYDASLKDKELGAIEDLAKTAAEGEKKLHARVMDALVGRARKAGIPEVKALTRIREIAKTNGWAIEVSTELSTGRLRTCPICGAPNEPDVKSCSKCHEPIDVICPRCGTKNARGVRNCENAKCLFAIGDMHLGEPLIQLARSVRQREPEQAVQLLDKAEEYWPGHPEAKQIREQVKIERDQRLKRAAAEQSVVEGILEFQAKRMFQTARDKISELEKVNPSHPRLAELRKINQKGLDSAAQEVARGHEFQRENRVDDAFASFERALTVCADSSDAKAALAGCPAAPPERAVARSVGSTIELTWQPSPSKGKVRYIVVRKVGGPPSRLADGTRLTETHETRVVDQTAPPGEACHYAIFSEREGALCEPPALSNPALRMLEVANLDFEVRDGGVTLRWSPPVREAQIEVWRCEGKEPDRGESVRVACFSDSAVDSGLVNGRAHGYRVLVVYKSPSGETYATAGLTRLVTPMAPPAPVKDLQVTLEGENFRGVFTAPHGAEVKIYCLEAPTKLAVGQLLGAAQLGALGKELTVVGGGHFEGRLNDANELFLLPVSVRGSVCVAGQQWSKVWTPEVNGLRVEWDGGAIVTRWEWPKGVTSAVLVARENEYASGPDDSRALAKTRVTLSQYQAAGGRVVLTLDRVADLRVTVFSLIESDGTYRYSPGTASGSRTQIHPRENRVARYRVVAIQQWLFLGPVKGNKLRLVVDGPVELPELKLVSKSDGLPLHPNDGRVVLSVSPRAVDMSSGLLVELDGVENPGWPVRNENSRLFHAHQEDGAWLQLFQG